MNNQLKKSLFLTLLFLSSAVLLVKCDSDADSEIEDDETSDSTKSGETPLPAVPFEPEDFVTPEKPNNAYFAELFPEPKLPSNWIISKAKKDDLGSEDIGKYNGEWAVSAPDQIVLKNDFCLIVKSKAHHHAISSKLQKPFVFNAGKSLIVQYEVKLQNGLECGGAYIKLLTGSSLNLDEFNDKTPYSIMFGPDKCGAQSKLHFIVKYRNPKSGDIKEHQAKQPDGSIEKYFSREKSHLYTLVLHPDDSYKVFVDETEVMKGDLKSTLLPAIVPEKEIEDPTDKKPEDWDEREKIPDLTAKKPDDWDENAPEKIEDTNAQKPSDWYENEPEYVPDEKAVKPTDWDEEMDGQYEAPLVKNPKCEKSSGCGPWKRPMIANPAYKGKWSAPMIDNPKYQGKWAPRRVANPEFFETESLFDSMQTINALGIELWTMSDGIAFDNFLITDDKLVADEIATLTWRVKTAAEERKSAKPSLFTTLIESTNDKPWLWAVYLLIILIPVVLISIFCFSGPKKDAAAEAKKTDMPSPDDTRFAGGDEDGVAAEDDAESNDEGVEADAAGDDDVRGTPKASPEKKQKSPSPSKVTKADLEGESDEEEKSLEKSRSSEGSKKSPRRRAARKAD